MKLSYVCIMIIYIFAGTMSTDVRFPEGSEVPAEETTYMCGAFDFEDSIKDGSFHMIGAEIIIDNAAVLHHLIVYGCPDDVGKNNKHRVRSTNKAA